MAQETLTIPYRKIFAELEARQIRYLIAGGFAVNLHQVQRATVDLDLIVDLEPANASRFIELMTGLEYTPNVPVPPLDFADPEKRRQWIEEKGMMVFSFRHRKNPLEIIDIFVEEPRPFGALWERRFEARAFGLTLRVLGREDLISIKREAGREKDLFDVKQLESLP